MDVDLLVFLNKEMLSAVAGEGGDLHRAGGMLEFCI